MNSLLRNDFGSPSVRFSLSLFNVFSEFYEYRRVFIFRKSVKEKGMLLMWLIVHIFHGITSINFNVGREATEVTDRSYRLHCNDWRCSVLVFVVVIILFCRFIRTSFWIDCMCYSERNIFKCWNCICCSFKKDLNQLWSNIRWQMLFYCGWVVYCWLAMRWLKSMSFHWEWDV